MEIVKDYKKIKTWGKSHIFTLKIYRTSSDFPKIEQLGITAQIRRAAVSIPANIVEGANRRSDKEFVSFLSISFGSASEVRYYLELCKDLNYIDYDNWKGLDADINEIQKLLSGLIKK